MNTSQGEATDPMVPSRARYTLVAWLCGLTAILYLDRICMSQAVVPIQKELGLSTVHMSYVAMAFTLAYGLFEIPTGRMGDKYGSRKILTRVVLWWSLFTALTGVCSGLGSLIAIRFLFGVGEAGAFPNAARVISRWFPGTERGRVQGIMLAAAQLGGVVAPIGAASMIEIMGWRWTFAVFGLIGVIWAGGFWWWFRDDPADHASVNAGELNLIRSSGMSETFIHQPVPWGAVFSNRGIIVLTLIMVFGAFYTYLFYTWFPKYLSEARGIDNITSGILSSIVLAGSAAGMLLGGWLADKIPLWFNHPVNSRRYLGSICYFISAVCLIVGIRCDNVWLLSFFLGASFCAMHVTLPNWWSVAIPQSGVHVGALVGLMNGMGFIGAMSSQWFVGFFANWRMQAGFTGRAQWDPMFDVYAGILLMGAVAWWCYRFVPLEKASSSSA